MDEGLKNILSDILYLVSSVAVSYGAYYINKFWQQHKASAELLAEEIKQKIGVSQYNQDVEKATTIIKSIEAQGKQFDWEGAVKHNKATQEILARTKLSEKDAFDIIKAVVDGWNQSKSMSIGTGISISTTDAKAVVDKLKQDNSSEVLDSPAVADVSKESDTKVDKATNTLASTIISRIG